MSWTFQADDRTDVTEPWNLGFWIGETPDQHNVVLAAKSVNHEILKTYFLLKHEENHEEKWLHI